jgi:alcohol dehydrogenase (cytochrome c)
LRNQKTFVRALKAETGELSWEYRFEADLRPTLSGVLSTAGNVLFAGGSGPKGLFVALNATTGQELWRSRLGGLIHSGPITFLNDGKQLVAVTAGHTLYVFEGGPAELSPRS